MLVRCIANTGADLPVNYIHPAPYGYPKRSTLFHLTIGKDYRVYAIEAAADQVGYYIADDDYSGYPTYACAPLFEVIDGRQSRFWETHVHTFERSEERWWSLTKVLGVLKLWNLAPRVTRSHTSLSTGFPGWGADCYEDLFDGEGKAQEIWDRYRRLMDLEFPDPTVTETPEICGEGWLFCNYCIDGWRPEGEEAALGVVVCPKCRRKYLNPSASTAMTPPA